MSDNFEKAKEFINGLSKEEINKLQCDIVNKLSKVSKVFIPKEGEEYWYIDPHGIICCTVYDVKSKVDKWYMQSGNCYRTKEEAKFAKEKLLVEVELQRFADEHNEGAYNFATCAWFSEIFNEVPEEKILNDFWFSSEEIAEQAIKEIGEDRIKKYLFGYY